MKSALERIKEMKPSEIIYQLAIEMAGPKSFDDEWEKALVLAIIKYLDESERMSKEKS